MFGALAPAATPVVAVGAYPDACEDSSSSAGYTSDDASTHLGSSAGSAVASPPAVLATDPLHVLDVLPSADDFGPGLDLIGDDLDLDLAKLFSE